MESQSSQKRTGLKVALLAITLTQMGTMGISVILSSITQVFAGVSDQQVQFLMSFPSVFVVLMNLLSAKLTEYIPEKIFAVSGLALVLLSGVGALCFHSSLVILYVWAAVLGIGLGICMPIPTAAAAEFFEGQERVSLIGAFTSIQNMGGIILSVVGGILAASLWYRAYFVYLLAIPGIICTILYFPLKKKSITTDEKKDKLKQKFKPDKNLMLYSLILCFFSIVYNVGPANVSLVVAERGLGDASTAGILTSFLLLGGVISGMVFGKLDKLIRARTITLGFIAMAVGFIITGLSTEFVLFFPGFFLVGCGLGFVLPQSSLQAVKGKNGAQLAMATAVMLAFGNLGAFIAPVMTGFSAVITGSGDVHLRLVVTAIVSFIFAVISLFVTKDKNPEKNQAKHKSLYRITNDPKSNV